MSEKTQINHPGQSQRTQTIQWANQNSKQIHVAGAKRGENVHGRVTIGFGFTSWLVEKVARVFLNQSVNVVMQNQSKWEIASDTQVKMMLRLGKIKTESTRKSSNIYLSWTKIEYQNNLNPIALFSTLNKR